MSTEVAQGLFAPVAEIYQEFALLDLRSRALTKTQLEMKNSENKTKMTVEIM